MAFFCPLHIWARELDSRILACVLASSQGVTSAVGHEYNLSEIYSEFKSSHLFRAGRPRNNYRISWNKEIIENKGLATIVDEEGNNDLEWNLRIRKKSYLPGVDEKGIDLCSRIQTWCTLQEKLIKESVADDRLRNRLDSKMLKTLNSRFELLLPSNRNYFQRRSEAIKNFFGNYVLISDNFGTFGFGGTDAINPSAFLGKDTNNELVAEVKETHVRRRTQSIEFAKIIRKLIINNPNVQFILRPHPIGSPIEWGKILGEHRNLYIIFKDTIEPWIISSKLMIHAGCTTGLQGVLLDANVIDISEMIPLLPGQEAISTKVSKRINSQEDLDKIVREIYFKQEKYEALNSKKMSTKRLLNQNEVLQNFRQQFNNYIASEGNSLDQVNTILSKDLELGKISSINSLVEDTVSVNSEQINSIDEANMLVNAIKKTKNKHLPQGKTSYIDSQDIERKIYDSAEILKCRIPRYHYSEKHKVLIVCGQNNQ